MLSHKTKLVACCELWPMRRASYDMLENLIQRASELRLDPTPSSKKTPKKASSSKSSVGSSKFSSGGDYQSGGLSDTSGALCSDDNFSSIEYSFEHSELEVVASSPLAGPSTGCGPMDFQSSGNLEVDSPGSQTLAALKLEALKDRSRQSRVQQGRHTIKAKTFGSRRKITRSCKIMKEAYFKGMEWTKTFVSGPVDPRLNPYNIYCQICKANISIYGKGAREVLRHHSTEKHLRKDQRWRYEYLVKTDLVIRVKTHQVRGKDGKILTPFQLELEYRKFKDAQLVDIGEKLPFYDEFMAGADFMSSSSDNRARIHISVLCRFLPHHGDLDIFRNFWTDVGVVVNHQSLFMDFDWTKERLSVSIILSYL